MFADDVKLYCRVDSMADVNHVQGELDKLCRWSERWGLKLNPTKCKVLTLTLRSSPVIGTYAIGGTALERVTVMRDLGIMLDQRLTFGEHVDHTVRKASRALGLLMRTFQTGKNGPQLYAANESVIRSTYYANVRSILEFGSVVWGGIAQSHMLRLERVQEKFLVWLSARCRVLGVSFEYQDLVEHFKMTTLKARFEQHDIMFIRNVHRHKICSSFLLDKFPLSVPVRQLRNQCLFANSLARVNTVKSCVFNRAPTACSTFLDLNRNVDIWQDSESQFKRHVVAYVARR